MFGWRWAVGFCSDGFHRLWLSIWDFLRWVAGGSLGGLCLVVWDLKLRVLDCGWRMGFIRLGEFNWVSRTVKLPMHSSSYWFVGRDALGVFDYLFAVVAARVRSPVNYNSAVWVESDVIVS